MKIESVVATPLRIPLVNKLSWAAGPITAFDNVLVEVRTSEGVSGFGEASPRTISTGQTPLTIVHAIETLLAPLLVNREVLGIEEPTSRLRMVAGHEGAKAAVEIAVLDAVARTCGVPCHRMLGGYAERLRVSAVLGFAPEVEVVEAAERWRAEYGVSHFKLKVGKDVERDTAVAVALRGRFPDADFYADANGAYSLRQAQRFAAVASELDFSMFEEPVRGRREQHALARSAPIDLVGDESCASVESAREAVLADRVQALSLKLNRTGPVGTGHLRSLCEAAGAKSLMGYESTSSVGAAASIAFAAATPTTACNAGEVLSFMDVRDDPRTVRLHVRDGMIVLDDAPGFGTDVDRGLVARLTQR